MLTWVSWIVIIWFHWLVTWLGFAFTWLAVPVKSNFCNISCVGSEFVLGFIDFTLFRRENSIICCDKCREGGGVIFRFFGVTYEVNREIVTELVYQEKGWCFNVFGCIEWLLNISLSIVDLLCCWLFWSSWYWSLGFIEVEVNGL